MMKALDDASTDPHWDKKLSLDSMSNISISGTCLIKLDVDYSRTITETYVAFTLACLESDQETPQTILRASLLRQHEPTEENFPSWAVDWRKEPKGSVVQPTDFKYCGYPDLPRILFDVPSDPLGHVDPKLPVVDERIEWRAGLGLEQFLLTVMEFVRRSYCFSGSHRRLEVLSTLRVLLCDWWLDLNGTDRKAADLRKIFNEYAWLLWCGASPPMSSLPDMKDSSSNSDHGASKICIFTAVGAIEHDRFLGSGNAALQFGDHLLTYRGQTQVNDGLRTHELPYCSALILRPTPAPYAAENIDTYRLVGSATLPFVHMEARKEARNDGWRNEPERRLCLT
jgi:hypothetical protein